MYAIKSTSNRKYVDIPVYSVMCVYKVNLAELINIEIAGYIWIEISLRN